MATPHQPTQPTDDQLIAYAAGELSAADARAVAAHVQRDAKAAALVAAYRAVRSTVQSDDGAAPPQRAIERAKAIFHTRDATVANRPGVLASWIESVDRFIATVIYDSRVQPAAVRFADPTAGDRINLTFETEGGEVDVQAERLGERHEVGREARRWRIMGQISSDSPGGRRELALVHRDASAAPLHAVADEHGTFIIDASAGAYELLLRDGNRVFVLTPIELK